jgi:uncharacterized membrane protein YedE/YeeE
MYEHFFADPITILLGALTGLVFGFLLQKGGVTRFSVIAGQFLMKDFTVLKVMLTAIVVGAIGIYGMRVIGMLDPEDMHIKNATLLGNGLGGLIFGIGMAVLGYCPGTGVAAIGDGSRHAIAGLIGMIVGAGVYAEVYPWMKSSILGIGDYGESTLASATGLSPWWFIVALAVIAIVLFLLLERAEGRRAGAV